jgi:hypothetical protein
MNMKLQFTALLLILIITGCNRQSLNQTTTVEKHTVLEVFKIKPVSVTDYLSPRYCAILENCDTVPIGASTRIGDTITYKYIKYDRP